MPTVRALHGYMRNLKACGIIWAQYGPYHFARARGLQEALPDLACHAIELSNHTRDYAWERSATLPELVTLCPDSKVETLPFMTVFRRTRQALRSLRIGVCLLPGYSPSQSLAALLATRSMGVRAIMMNESHAGTARAGRIGRLAKRALVGLFGAALVGGQPQKRYFTALGMAVDRIFTGYDAVDNDYFRCSAAEVRSRSDDNRRKHGLPNRFFLSLGRFVPKKNLETLIRAYALFLTSQGERRSARIELPHLVLVGSGETEPMLRRLCAALNLPVVNHLATASLPTSRSINAVPAVHFHGFRQQSENPVFYGLAEAFVLPSLWEEWGLVVNEAMASGLPVIVSRFAGCAEDLLPPATADDFPNLPWLRDETGRLDLGPCLRRTGFVFDPQSVMQLSRILGLLSNRSELRHALGCAAGAWINGYSCENFGRNARLAVEAAFGASGERDGLAPRTWAIRQS